MATGTSRNFSITGGAWSGYTATVDDAPTTASSGVLVNNLRQWEWDIGQGSTFYTTGTDHMIYFKPGSTASNGEWWQHGGTPVLGTRSGTTITLGTVAVFDETAAFVNGVIPTTSSTNSNSGSGGGTNTGSIGFTLNLETPSVISFTIDANSVSDAWIDYKVTWLSGLNVLVYGPYGHTLGTADTYNISSNDSMLGTWSLITDTGNLVTVLDSVVVGGPAPPPPTPPSTGSRKKVHSNFW